MEEENKKEKEGASFSMQVKEELSYVEGASRHCQLAELAALVLCCGRLVDKKMDDDDENSCTNKTLLFESENETVLRKYFTFVQKTFNIELMRVHKGNGYALELNEQDTKKVLQAIELSEGEPLENCVADSRLLLRNCCRRAFVRGSHLWRNDSGRTVYAHGSGAAGSFCRFIRPYAGHDIPRRWNRNRNENL